MIEPKPTMSLLTAEVAALKAQMEELHLQDRLKTREINTLVPENRNLIAERDELRYALNRLLDSQSGTAMSVLHAQEFAREILAKTAPVNPNAGVVQASPKGRWTP